MNRVVTKDIWQNTHPVLLWLLLEPIVGLIDSRVAGLIDLNTLSAIGIGETIYFVFIWIFVFLAYGTTPLVSSFNTKKEYNSLNFFIDFGTKAAIILGTVSFVVLFFSNNFFINLFKPTLSVSVLSSDYLVFRCLGLPFYLLNMYSTAVLRGLKYPKITLYSSLVVSALNILFSLFFGLYLGFGAAGIGFASSLSFLVASIYSSKILSTKRKKFENTTDFVDKRFLVNKFFSIGLFIFVRSFFLTGFMAYLRNRSSIMSMEEIALQHVLLQIWSLGYVFVDSVAIASQTLVSELVSKKENFEKSELQLHLFKITGILSTVLFFLSFFIVSILVDVISGQNLSQFISRNVEVYFAISLLIGCFAFLWDGVLLGLDKSKEFSIITILSSILGGILCNALLTYSNTIEMLWISLNFSLIIRCVLGFYFQRNS
jgi:MATE family multidrug resistance protein